MKKFLLSGVKAVMLMLTLLSFLKGILISLDIDESYAVAMGYRMATGDRLIRDMWEPHQFSGFLAAFFTAPYMWLRGSTEYLVIYLRIVSVLIHTGLGVILYRRIRKSQGLFWAFVIMILHMQFLPKWVQTLEFELIHYWCLLGIFLILHAYFVGAKPGVLLPFTGGYFWRAVCCAILPCCFCIRFIFGQYMRWRSDILKPGAESVGGAVLFLPWELLCQGQRFWPGCLATCRLAG